MVPHLRWMVAVWLVRVLDGGSTPMAPEASSFVDVEEDKWWALFVERLVDLEVTAGCAVARTPGSSWRKDVPGEQRNSNPVWIPG